MFALSQASSKRILMWGSLLGFNSTWSLPAGTFRTGEGNENSESLRNENSESLRLLWLLDVHFDEINSLLDVRREDDAGIRRR